MFTFGTLTITVPLSRDGFDFEELRAQLAQVLKKPLAKSTLHDWIKNICLLREDNIYAANYSEDELGKLLEWITYRHHYGPKVGARKYREHLAKELENNYATN
jgi:hypothetical protein